MEQAFRGNLFHGGESVLENVEGILYVDTDSKGFGVWGGSIDIPNYGSVDIGGEQYVLALDDGRRGKLVVTRKTGLEPVQIEFEGTGRLEATV